MREDFIFHLVPEKVWKTSKQDSRYTPQSIESQGFIYCATGNQAEQVANRLYKGERRILLLVINTALVEPEIKYEEDAQTGQKFPHIYGPLNSDAIVDRIRLVPENDGSFKISFASDE